MISDFGFRISDFGGDAEQPRSIAWRTIRPFQSAIRNPQSAIAGQQYRKPGLTFLEVTIAIGLLTILMSAVFWFYSSAMETRTQSLKKSQQTHLARVVLAQLAEEIRQASGFTAGYGPGLVGEQYGLSINTLTIPDRILSQDRSESDVEIPGQFDLREITYYLAADEENLDENDQPRVFGMVRKESKTYGRAVIIDEEEGVGDEEQAEEAVAIKEELYAPEIKFLEFRYFDGASWWKTWDLAMGNTLPQLVRITIGFKVDYAMFDEDEVDVLAEIFESDEEDVDPLPGDQYSMFVRMNQGDSFFGSRISRAADAFSASASLGE